MKLLQLVLFIALAVMLQSANAATCPYKNGGGSVATPAPSVAKNIVANLTKPAGSGSPSSQESTIRR
jgi:hypothetical protein